MTTQQANISPARFAPLGAAAPPTAPQAPAGPDPDFATAESSIARAREGITTRKKEILAAVSDQRALQWKGCNLDNFTQLLALLEIPPGLAEARDIHPRQAKELFYQLERCENNLGAIEIDARRRTISPKLAESQTQGIIAELAATDPDFAEWRGRVGLLFAADAKVRQALSLSALLPLCKQLSKQGAHLVEEGYEFLQLVAGKNARKGQPNISDYQAQAIDLEKRIRAIDLAGLPGLACASLNQMFRTLLAATDQIKEFVEFFLSNLPSEVAAVRRLEQEMEDLRKETMPELLGKLGPLISSLTRNLIDLRHRARAQKPLTLLPVVLKESKLLQQAIKTGLIPDLKRKVGEPGSPLNPAGIAAEKTVDFFVGLKGLMRSIKLIFTVAGGQQPLKPADLQQKITEILEECSVHSGSKAELAKLQAFLDQKLEAFSRPFPYEGILQIAKESIDIYSTRLEKEIFGFEVSGESDEEGNQTGKAIPIGHLLAKIEVRTANLESASNQS